MIVVSVPGAKGPTQMRDPHGKIQQRRHRDPRIAGVLVALLLVSGSAVACEEGPERDPFRDAVDVAELDGQSLFTFAIFSDNKGTGPASGIAMAGMTDGVGDMGAQFVLGLGDHLQGRPPDDQRFVEWVINESWWAT